MLSVLEHINLLLLEIEMILPSDDESIYELKLVLERFKYEHE